MVQMAGLRDDARIMAAGRQQVADVGVGLLNDLVSRAPGSDVIADGTNREDRCADVGECNRLAIGLKVSAASSLFKYKRRRYSECMR